MTEINWSLAMFVARETPSVLMRSVAAVLAATRPRMTIEILTNGNTALAQTIAGGLIQGLQIPAAVNLRLWHIPYGDKANAWNQFLHHIWQDQPLAFFVDGYARPRPDALRVLGDAVMGSHCANAGSGVPTIGFSATALRTHMLKNGGFHGNLCCVTGDSIARIKQRGIRLPVGLYRTDSLMETILAYDLDPAINEWDDARVVVHGAASWDTDKLVWWHRSSLLVYWSRQLRQAQGNLEKQAFKDFFDKRQLVPELLPANCREMIEDWMLRCPRLAQATLRGHPLRQRALQRLLQEPNPLPQSLLPTLIWSSVG
ncbi:MAG: hypothetical protein JZU64_11480 [Rhodoferax sp.]|nr:hypothetical protein [Rhodoferax sp.]